MRREPVSVTASSTRLPSRGRSSPSWRSPSRLLGTVAVAGLIAASAWLAAGASGMRWIFLIPASQRGGFPTWLAGPLHGLGITIVPHRGAQLVVAMLLCYLVVVACARALSPRLVVAAVLITHLAFVLAPPLFSADVFGYIDYARLAVLHGLNPYSHGAADAAHDPVVAFVRWHDIATPYGPLFTLASLPLGWLSVPAALWVCKSLAGALSLACIALVWRIAGRRGDAPSPAVAFVGLNPLLLAYGVGGAHNDFLLLALTLLAILLVLDERPARAGFMGMLAVGVKVSAALVLPFLVLGTQRVRAALNGVVAATAVLLVLAVAAFGSGAFGFLGQVREQQKLVATYSVPSRFAALLGFDGTPAGLRLLLGLALIATVLALAWRTWRRRADWIAAAGWATLALLLSTAWLTAWYVVWLLPLAALGRDRRLQAATLLFCVYVVATRVTYQLA